MDRIGPGWSGTLTTENAQEICCQLSLSLENKNFVLTRQIEDTPPQVANLARLVRPQLSTQGVYLVIRNGIAFLRIYTSQEVISVSSASLLNTSEHPDPWFIFLEGKITLVTLEPSGTKTVYQFIF